VRVEAAEHKPPFAFPSLSDVAALGDIAGQWLVVWIVCPDARALVARVDLYEDADLRVEVCRVEGGSQEGLQC
jgi:hypothetical protein